MIRSNDTNFRIQFFTFVEKYNKSLISGSRMRNFHGKCKSESNSLEMNQENSDNVWLSEICYTKGCDFMK